MKKITNVKLSLTLLNFLSITRIMKLQIKKPTILGIGLLSIFLLIGSVSFAQNPNQRISINVKNISIKELIKVIESKTTYTVVYRDVLVDDKKDITINEENKPLTDVLKSSLSSKGLQVVFNNNTIVITKKNAEPQITTKTIIVSGVVLDEKGQPVIGASVIIPGTTIGVATDINGRFTLEALSNSKIRISYIGYDAKEELVNTSLRIVLEPTPQALKEIVITAQAIGQKNAILQQINSNTIKNVVAADRLQENPDANSVEAIGRLPGISVQRSGGEGVGLVIRGLLPRYTSVTLNGIELPSTSGADRSTNLSGISQYALQGAEVFKSLTAEMDANSVAGAVNLKLREAPKGFHANVMAQNGYNKLNNYWGNYKFLTELSNRFFNDKLGLLFTANAEKVNRSVETMSAAYNFIGNENSDILIGNFNLEMINRFIYRQSIMLSLDYKLTSATTLSLYSLYNRSQNASQNQSKSYDVTGSGSVRYNFSSSPNAHSDIMQTALSGESNLKFLKLKAEYGISYSNGLNNNTAERNWTFKFDGASTSAITDIEHRKLDPSEIQPLYTDNPDSINNCWLERLGMNNSKMEDKNLNLYLNLTIPFKLKNLLSGYVKFGGLYRNKNRIKDDTSGSQWLNSSVNVAASQLLKEKLEWISLDKNNNITANGITSGQKHGFLNDKYNFGLTFDLDRLNQISSSWEDISTFYYNQGPAVYQPIFGGENKLGYAQNVEAMMMEDQNIHEKYYAAFIQSEINLGKIVMFLPGVRFESTSKTLEGRYTMPPTYIPSTNTPVAGVDTMRSISDTYILPMIHLRIKPTEKYYFHFAYTHTLSRPDYNSISPNYYVNTGWAPVSYRALNPDLKPELWKNFDAQFVLHDKKIGLLSINAFYKTVQNKIWTRTYQRIKGDKPLPPFPDNQSVTVSVWENQNYKGFAKGLEFEWQTSFWYLPKPFSYFTLTTNYTLSKSEIAYPYTRLQDVVPEGGGRPVRIRIDSIINAPMIFQPTQIANVSLGFNRKGFNAWFSYQYNGDIFTNIRKDPGRRLDALKKYFYRLDLQIAQKFVISNKYNLEVLLNLANASDYAEKQTYRGESRNSYIEKYGFTSDLGVRLRF